MEVLQQTDTEVRLQVLAHEQIFRAILRDFASSRETESSRFYDYPYVNPDLELGKYFAQNLIGKNHVLGGNNLIGGFHVDLEDRRAEIFYGVAILLAGPSTVARYRIEEVLEDGNEKERSAVVFDKNLIRTEGPWGSECFG